MTEPDRSGLSDPLPEPVGAPYRIAMVCLGNICRSPTAAVVLRSQLDEAGLDGAVEVTSAGTGDWHVGERIDPRAGRTLAAAGYDASEHRARHFDADWFDRDLVLVMDTQNLFDVRALGGRPGQVRLLRSFDPVGGPDADVPDPWSGGQQCFDDVLAMVERTCEVLVERLDELLSPTPG